MMKSHFYVVWALMALVGAAGCSRSEPATATVAESAKSPVRIGRAPLSQIGFAVRDVDAAARKWSEILGVPASETRTVALQLPDASTVEVKVASLSLPNSRIDLNQPVTEGGPVQDHLDKFGPGVHYIGFSVKDDVDTIREELERIGGKWTGGAPKGEYAMVDFRERFGVTLRITRETLPPLLEVGEGDTSASLGKNRVSHIGLAVRNYDNAAGALGKAIGVPAVPPRTTDVVYPPGHKWNEKATGLRLATSRIPDNMGIEIIEPGMGPTPWTVWVEQQRGDSLQHIGFDIDTADNVERWVQFMKSKGGIHTVGVPKALLPQYVGKASSLDGTFYAYVDFPELGVTLAVLAPRLPRNQVASR